MTAIRQYPMVGGTSTTEGVISYIVDSGWPPFLAWTTVTNGHMVRYVATDGTQFEEGYGFKSAGPTLSRFLILRTSSNDTDKIDWGTGTRVVYIVPDIDTIYENDDNADFVRFLKAPQVESGGRRFRWWTSDGVMRLSDATVSPFVNMLIYNALAGTPKFQVQVLGNFTEGLQLAGVNVTSVATSPFATEAEADAGSATDLVMSPLRTQNAIAHYPVAIGNRTERTTLEATDMLHIGVPTGELMRKASLANLKALMNTPDFTALGVSLSFMPAIFTHGLGAEPRRVEAVIRIVTSHNGFVAGDAYDVMTHDTDSSNRTATIGRNAASVWVGLPAAMSFQRRSDNVLAAITYDSCAIEIRAWR